jgi:hypothetical protein
MTDNDIIKGLVSCAELIDNPCSQCPYLHGKPCLQLKRDALNLINRQKAEIERLSHKCDDCAGCTQWVCDCRIIEAEAVREFAERLCEGRVSNDPVVIAVKAELKGMVGE